MTQLTRPFLLLLLLVTCHLPAFPQAHIPLEKYAGNLKALQVEVQGKMYRFLFDTGGGETIISPEVAQALGKTPYGQIIAFRMHGEKVTFQKIDSVELRINGQRLFQDYVAVWNLMRILPAGLPRLDGVISLKTFNGHILGLDLQNNRLTLEDKRRFKKKAKDLTLLKSRFATGLAGNEMSLFLEVEAGPKQAWFLFDSANLRRVLISPAMAPFIQGGQALALPAEIEQLPLRISGEMVTVPGAVEDILYDGALNYAFISQNTYYLDLMNYQVWKK